jgi:acetyl-CoA carboxylase carboxyltransferase component
MCCKDTGADFMFAWPGARVCIVGAETAASIIFAREIKEASNPEEMKAKRIGEYRQLFENPYCGAARGFIDDVIMPSDTRKIINKALDLLENKAVVRLPRKYSNINL